MTNDELLIKIKNSKKVVALTGAGVSAESGVATFRDPDGLWTKFNPAELASMKGFLNNPELVWSWYNYRRDLINKVKPNAGHYAIAEMTNIFPEFTLITQNVDRLHQQAGSNHVIELHGNIIENHCANCKSCYFEEIDLSQKTPPTCKYCGGKIRPSVIWFGENLPEFEFEAAMEATEECDLFFSIGTNAEVYPAGNLPMLAMQHGAFTIEVNPNETIISENIDVHIKEKSGVALPKIIEALKMMK